MSKSIHGFATVVLLVVGACGDAGGSAREPLPWFGRTRGSAVVLSRDERVAVVVSRSAGVVTVFALDPEAPLEKLVKKRTEIDMGAGSEPWAAVIGGHDDTAFVISRHDQVLTRIADLHGAPRIRGALAVGSEPTAIAIAPSGKRLFVANWGDGTISVVTTPDFRVRGTLDLNDALAGTGVLGDVEVRAGLAHPRALAVTDNGDDDDDDETLYATEFFSMPLLDSGSDLPPNDFDRSRQGFVYPIPLSANGRVGDPIPIAPVADTGFADATGATTGCFPNQLYAAAAAGDRLFVTSMCASPEGPLGPAPDNPDNLANFKTLVHPAVFVIDTRSNKELPKQHVLLTHELEQRYTSDPTASRRMPLIPNDIVFTPPADAGTDTKQPSTGCITAMGADAVFCMHYDAEGRLRDIGSRKGRYLDLAPLDQRAGRLPVGIAVSQQRSYGLVVSDNSQTLTVVDLAANAVRAVERTADKIPRAVEVLDSLANTGRQHFATGLDVWSFKGEAWLSCEGCHPDGQSDGVTWFFARGPRRTISTAGTYDGDGERRVLLWTGNVDEVHDVEGIVRSVAGGVGAVLWRYPDDAPSSDFRIVYDGKPVPPGKPTSTLRNNLNGSVKELFQPPMPGDPVCDMASTQCDRSPVFEWDELDAFIKSVRAPRRPTSLDSVQVDHGATLFRDHGCTACHGGPGWTLSRVFYTPGAQNNGALPYSRPKAVTDDELGRLRTETYSVPAELRALNPPGAMGTATFRRWDPGDRDRVVHLYGTDKDDGYDSRKTHGNDQINCVLRAVGTFPDQAGGENLSGIVPPRSPMVVREVRDNMTTLALGATGFNMPSLVGIAAGAPYFHAGNARTLEEVFDPAFAPHHQALAPGFSPDANEVRNLIAYVLSIDDEWPIERVEPGRDLCVPAPGQIE